MEVSPFRSVCVHSCVKHGVDVLNIPFPSCTDFRPVCVAQIEAVGLVCPFQFSVVGQGSALDTCSHFLFPEYFAILFKNGGIVDGKESA